MKVDIAAKALINMKNYAEFDETECEAVNTVLGEILNLREQLNKLNELNMQLTIENETLKQQLNEKSNINKAIDRLSDFSFNKSVVLNNKKDKMIELMLQDLSQGAYYEDDAAQICEVKHGECTRYKDVECSKCLFEYYLKKAEADISK